MTIYEAAEIWYLRSFKLRNIWLSETEPENRKQKALKIWFELLARLTYIQSLIKYSELKRNYKKGGEVCNQNT
jgi:hypothetical protein